MIDKLTFVEFKDEWYLGELKETEAKIVLSNACRCETNHNATFIKWIKMQNLGTLTKMQASASNAVYVERPLDPEDKRLLKRLWEDMQEVKRTAIPRLENKYFSEQ